jgi:hypothetical protein
MAGLLPEHTLRHDFNLFVGTLLQRRWQHFVFSLGETGVEMLLERVGAAGTAAMQTLRPAPAQRGAGAATAGKPPMKRSATTGANV